MSEQLRSKLQKFYEEYWPIPYPPISPTKSELREIDRLVWYCNISGNPIPELQKYNKANIKLEYPMFTEKDLLSVEFYHKNNQNRSYRVYSCGHAFLDIHLLCAVFDAFYYNHDKSKIPKVFEDMRYLCPMCSNQDKNAGNTQSLYGVSGRYCGGTVHTKTTIPKKMLPYLKPAFTNGDVVDTKGYRGTGLKIFENGEFHNVHRYDYYPCWKLEQLQKYGYRKLLTSLIWCGDIQFDKIELEHNLYINYDGRLKCDDLSNKTDFSSCTIAMNVTRDEDNLIVTFRDKVRKLKTVNGLNVMDDNFDSAEEFWYYTTLNHPIKVKVSDYDYLVINTVEKTGYDEYGEEMYDEVMYFTDLEGNNRVNVSRI